MLDTWLRRMRFRIVTATSSVVVLAPMALAPMIAVAGENLDDGSADDVNRFFDSEYTYCDAEVISKAWGIGVYEAKAHIGWKLNADPSFLETQLTEARIDGLNKKNACYYFAQDTYSYADAETIAKLWGLDVAEAKAHISYKVAQAYTDQLDQVLGRVEGTHALGHSPDAETEDESLIRQAYLDEGFQAFLASDYDYCDAEVLSDNWSMGVTEAKAYIGHKVSNDSVDALETTLGTVRVEARDKGNHCWVRVHGYDDKITGLAAAWKVSEAEARTRADDWLAQDKKADLDAVLGGETAAGEGDAAETPKKAKKPKKSKAKKKAPAKGETAE